jgi:hypothetical protein
VLGWFQFTKSPAASSSRQIVDCHKEDGTADSELGYPTMYHWEWHPKPNPSIRIPRNYVTSIECVSSSPKLQSNGQTSRVSSDKTPPILPNMPHFGTGETTTKAHSHNQA